MRNLIVIKVALCLLSSSGVLYAYLQQQNELTKLKIDIPKLAKEVRMLDETNTRLRYEIEQFENPENLLIIAKRPEFGHLRYPVLGEILVMNTIKTPHEEVKEGKGEGQVLSSPQILLGSF